MKIESTPLDSYRQIADRVGEPTTSAGDPAAKAPVTPGAPADRVALSGDAQRLQAAIRSAQDAPDIRQDLVERLRADLRAGKVGQDAGSIADAMLDSWLQESQ